MLSIDNLLSPADGGPIVAPTQDMVLGCYYMTLDVTGDPGQEPSRQLADGGRGEARPTRSGDADRRLRCAARDDVVQALRSPIASAHGA